MVKLKPNSLCDDRSYQIVSWGHWFALFNIFLVIIIGSRYFFIADWPQTLLGRVYAIMSCIGHFSFLTFIVYLVVLFPLSFFIHSSRWQRVIAVIVASIALTLLLIDIVVFSYFRMHLNFSIWQILSASNQTNALSSQLQKMFIFVPFILLLETVFAIWSWRKLRSLNKRSRYCFPVIIILVGCFISSHLIHIWADANFYRPITMQRSSLPISYPLTARHFLERYGFIEHGNYESRIKQEGNPFAIAIEYPLEKISYQRAKTPYNILMVVIDDWNYDDQLSNMPKLAKFANEHILFTNHFSSSNASSLGEFSLFYGLDANYYNSILASHKSSVFIDTLTKQHYSLGLFSTNYFNQPLYHYALLSNFSMPAESAVQSPSATTDLWLSWYNNLQKIDNIAPWFSILQYHNGRNSVGAKQQKTLDNVIDSVMQSLQKTRDIDRTVVIITASNALSQSNVQRRFNRQQLKVPLIIAWPNKKAQVIASLTSHVDIVQTLMQDVLQVSTASRQYSQGGNLFLPNSREWLIAGSDHDIAALYPDKTILIDDSGHYQIYDLNGQIQSKETLDLSTFLQLVTENRRFMVTH